MSVKTKIQWCDSTVNPTMGCEGCEIWGPQRKTCYAGTLHVRFGGATPGYSPSFDVVTQFPGRMREAASWPDLRGKARAEKPWLNGLPRIIFVSDMSDSLSATVPFEYLRDEIIANVRTEPGQRHQWLWLSKRPDRMAKFSRWLGLQGISWPPNLWAGTSLTAQATTSRIKSLVQVGDERTIHFLSVEPQVEPIDLLPWLPRIDWVIHGGESGRGARPFDLSWARSLISQCATLGVPYFLKQLGSNVVESGEKLFFKDNHAGDWEEWPEAVQARQIAKIYKAVNHLA
ncbi:MAG: Bacteriophage protein gp37 [Planctomycetota bacterium]|nr:Bacteriophage protein gp37 [Planctomycetota bacterium]